MPLQGSTWITHRFGGGWSTDFGPTYYGGPDQGAGMIVPYLRDARNVVFEFDGGVHKVPGTRRLNSTVTGGGATVRGVFDYWKQGASDAAAQQRIIHVDDKIMYDQADGEFLTMFSGMATESIPHYNQLDDLLLIASSSTVDLPRQWDGTTGGLLAGSPPRFSFSVTHKNHVFAAGDFAHPSRLYYCVPLFPDDWTGIGSGSIDIDPGDGDMITGLISHKDSLFVFKGPHKGSIHRITGASQSDWTKVPFINGLPVAWIHSIFKFGDDIGFITTNGSVHSLNATAAYGDFNQRWLSYPINKYLQENLNNNRARYFVAATDPNRGQVWIGVTLTGQTTNQRFLIMDYRFLSQNEQYPRWSYWDARPFCSITLMRDLNRPTLAAGGYDGFVYKLGQTQRVDTNRAINMRVETPSMTYGEEWLKKNLSDVGISLNAWNNNFVRLDWTLDGATTQYAQVRQGSTGALYDVGIFDTARFGGQSFLPRFYGLETGGDFRSVSFTFSDSQNNSDLEIHSFMTKLTPAGESQEND